MSSILLRNGIGIEVYPPKVEKVDVRIAGGTIQERNSHLEPNPTEEVLDLSGKLILPGLVCAHTHLYSALARGMPGPKSAPRNFLEILQQVWWKLDRALDEEMIYYSALIGTVEAALAGTTTLIDHHASPGAIRGSLGVIRRAVEQVGLRAVLCYEVTDRGGREDCGLGLAENRDLLSRTGESTIRGLVGAHASFTLEDASLMACADLAREFKTGVHIHVAEDPCDEEDAQKRSGKRLVQRLADAGVLTARSILAHATHLTKNDLSLIKEKGSWLIHNPRSNMNNAVGYARAIDFGARAALGTDGISMDMFAETQAAFFKSRDAQGGLSPQDCLRLLAGGQALASELFSQPLGTLTPGAAADLVILNYRLPTPLNDDNLAGHFIFGMNAAQVESVLVNGRFIVRNRTLGHLTLDTVYREAQRAAQKLWSKM